MGSLAQGDQAYSAQASSTIGLSEVSSRVVGKVLQARLRPDVEYLRDLPQWAYTPGRGTLDAALRVQAHCQSVMMDCQPDSWAVSQVGGFQLSLDLSAAFDTLEWCHIAEALQDAGVPESFHVFTHVCFTLLCSKHNVLAQDTAQLDLAQLLVGSSFFFCRQHELSAFLLAYAFSLNRRHSSSLLAASLFAFLLSMFGTFMRPDAWFHASGFTASLTGYAIDVSRAGQAFAMLYDLLPTFLREMPAYCSEASDVWFSDIRGSAKHGCSA